MSLMDPPPHDPRHDQYQILEEMPATPFVHSLDRPTLRAILAGMALNSPRYAECHPDKLADLAVKQADALLKRLEE